MLTAAWTKQLPLQHITAITPVGGGDVNQAYRVDTAEKPYFLLVQPGYPANFYAGEIAGLKSFEQADILAPRVIANGTIEGDGYLLLRRPSASKRLVASNRSDNFSTGANHHSKNA